MHFFFYLRKKKSKNQKQSGKVSQYLGWVCLKVHPGEVVSLVSASTNTMQMETILWFFFSCGFHFYLFLRF